MNTYEKKYKDALVKLKKHFTPTSDGIISGISRELIEDIFPELNGNKDDRIRKALIRYHQSTLNIDGVKGEEILAWLEKQGNPKLTESEDERIKKWLIEYFQQYKIDGMEVVYTSGFKVDDIIAWLEKQSEQKEYTFKALPRLLDMIEPTERAKAYCQKLIDSLVKEEYFTDAKIVGECLKKMNGENVPMAIMDEKQGKTINSDELAQGVLRGAAINLITWIDYNAAEGNMCLSNMECKDIEDALVNGDWNKIYAYMKKKLERQDEQKHAFDFNANNWYVSKVDGKIHNIYNSGVEPKFHKFNEGDWVVSEITGSVYQIKNCIENLSNHKCGYDLIGGGYIGSDETEHYHRWTIADAKDGDVLKYKNCTFIFKKTEPSDIVTNIKNPLTVLGYCGINRIGFEKTNGWGDTANCKYHPATKGQRDLLFAKMKEEGYEWDADKKELKKIEEQPLQWNISDYRTWQYIVSDVLTKHDGIGQYLDNGFCQKIAKYMQENWSKKLSLGQNPTWSEEDEHRAEDTIYFLDTAKKHYASTVELDACVDWLKSLKQRMGG